MSRGLKLLLGRTSEVTRSGLCGSSWIAIVSDSASWRCWKVFSRRKSSRLLLSSPAGCTYLSTLIHLLSFCWTRLTVLCISSLAGSRHRLLATTIAGFLSQSRSTRASDLFDNHWQKMVSRIDDPYARIVLSRIGGEGWESIMREEAVPILDRVAIAACNLDDSEVRSPYSMLSFWLD